jgi:outer membrane receptor protein involved in Fe transport
MFSFTSLQFKKTLLLSTSLIIMSFPLAAKADGELPAADIEGDIIAVDGSTVVYGQAFIAQQSGMVTAVDLINRIPGGSSYLNENNNNQKRGFSNNDDRILINGNRVAGKSNTSFQVLSRIPADQVLRVEVIRGSSPDIKTSSQDALLNVVLRDDAGGSGSWLARANIIKGQVSGAVEGSYTDKYKFLDYTVALDLSDFKNSIPRGEVLFDAQDVGIFSSKQTLNRQRQEGKFSSNMTLNLNNGDQIHINGQFSDISFTEDRPSDLLNPDTQGNLTLAGAGQYNRENKFREWELGLDYDTDIAEKWELKLIALHKETKGDRVFGEDLEIANGVLQQDYLVDQNTESSESIGRAALVWSHSADHRLEIGSELAFNKRFTDFKLFNLINGALVQEDVEAGLVTIKEVRDESFIIHSWQISEKISLDSALTYEYSKISQTGNIQNERSFKFWKPSFDLRYNIDPRHQLQFSVRREVEQLNFDHFASSFSGDNQIQGGNTNLSPQRAWIFETSYEFRLNDDLGYIKPTFLYKTYANKLGLIEISPNLSGVGNAGKGERIDINLEGALRFSFIGMPNLKLTADLEWMKTEFTDPFTGEKASFSYHPTTPNGSIELRHDIPEYGLSWEVEANINDTTYVRDIDELTIRPNGWHTWVNFAVEKQIFDGIVLRATIDNIFNPEFSRERYFYETGRAGGVLTNNEIRTQHFNRQIFLTLKGTF